MRSTEANGRAATALAACLVASLSCDGVRGAVLDVERPRPPLEAPASCNTVTPTQSLSQRLARAGDGDAFCLTPGIYGGPIDVPQGVAVFGPREASIRSRGVGTTVVLHARSALVGVTVDGSGGRFDTLDAAVLVRGDDALVRGVRIVNSVFGILSHRVKRVRIVGNHVTGSVADTLGMRGDAIRLWETHTSTIEDNRVDDARDVVVWYSSKNVLRRNVVERSRYGTHFMHSHDNVVEDSRYVENEVGIFVMYSRNLEIRNNVLARASGAAGMGLGAKESGNMRVVHNRFIGNTMGVFLDASPFQLDDANLFEANEIRFSDVGIAFHSSERGNTIRDNDFRDNRTQVAVENGRDAMATTWSGNAFDDYRGYDLDGDAVGDVPYELRDLSGDLVSLRPDLAFLRGTAALMLVRIAGQVVPLFQPKPLLVDARPRMTWLEVHDAR